jgi:hypothetical protein
MHPLLLGRKTTQLVQDDCQFVFVVIRPIWSSLLDDTFFKIKVKILKLIKWSSKSPSNPLIMLIVESKLNNNFEDLVQSLLNTYIFVFVMRSM